MRDRSIDFLGVNISFDGAATEPTPITYQGDDLLVKGVKRKLKSMCGQSGHLLNPDKCFPIDLACALAKLGADIDTQSFFAPIIPNRSMP